MFTYGFVQEPGIPGQDGASAYQIAVANGFVGTEEEWLASLVGLGVPAGGLEGQMVVKASDADYDTIWIDNLTDTLRVVVKNDSGVALARGTAVMAVGATGDQIRVAPAVSDGTVSAQFLLGVAAEDIPNGGTGQVGLLGQITNLDTSMYTLGTILYINPAAPGQLTDVVPVAPALDLAVAIVIRQQQTSGRIFVRMWSQGQRLSELFDVNTSGAVEGSSLVLNGNGIWVAGTGTGGAFVFTQTTASSTWLIEHGLGFYPNVTIEDGSGNDISGAITYIDANSLQIDFNTATTGVAYLS